MKKDKLKDKDGDMAYGGMLETLATPVAVDNGFGGTIQMTHRSYTVTISCPDMDVLGPEAAPDPHIVSVSTRLGCVVNGAYRSARQTERLVTLRRSDVDALSQVTLAALLAAAKARLGLP